MNKTLRFVVSHTDVIVVCLFMLLSFAYVMFGIADGSDLPSHAQGAKNMLENNRLFESNFLMYFMVNLLTGFSGNLLLIKVALVVLIALSNTFKYVLVKNEFSQWFPLKQAKIASAALLFVFVIPVFYFMKIFGIFLNTNNMCFQYCVPNVWHNSTILCMMPFAILTFFLSVNQFKNYDKKRNKFIVLFVLLSTLIKPSFFFIYVIAYPLCMFVRFRFSKEFFHSLVPILIGCFCVLYEFFTIYNGSDDSGIAIRVLPLFTFGFWKSRILYFSVSMALPLFFVLIYRKEIEKDYEFWFILIMLVVALGISWCCYETGPRAYHGNFGWQVIAAMWFVYYYMIKIAMKMNHKIQYKNSGIVETSRESKLILYKLFMVLYSVHVFMGILYLIKYMVTKDMA